jgi:hypothetical protein
MPNAGIAVFYDWNGLGNLFNQKYLTLRIRSLFGTSITSRYNFLCIQLMISKIKKRGRDLCRREENEGFSV